MPKRSQVDEKQMQDIRAAALEKFGGASGLMEKLHAIYEATPSIPMQLRVLEDVMGLLKGAGGDKNKTDEETEAEMEAIAKSLMEAGAAE